MQQRGVGATVNIIKQLISGVAKEPQNLLVVDLLPSRPASPLKLLAKLVSMGV